MIETITITKPNCDPSFYIFLYSVFADLIKSVQVIENHTQIGRNNRIKQRYRLLNSFVTFFHRTIINQTKLKSCKRDVARTSTILCATHVDGCYKLLLHTFKFTKRRGKSRNLLLHRNFPINPICVKFSSQINHYIIHALRLRKLRN